MQKIEKVKEIMAQVFETLCLSYEISCIEKNKLKIKVLYNLSYCGTVSTIDEGKKDVSIQQICLQLCRAFGYRLYLEKEYPSNEGYYRFMEIAREVISANTC